VFNVNNFCRVTKRQRLNIKRVWDGRVCCGASEQQQRVFWHQQVQLLTRTCLQQSGAKFRPASDKSSVSLSNETNGSYKKYTQFLKFIVLNQYFGENIKSWLKLLSWKCRFSICFICVLHNWLIFISRAQKFGPRRAKSLRSAVEYFTTGTRITFSHNATALFLPFCVIYYYLRQHIPQEHSRCTLNF